MNEEQTDQWKIERMNGGSKQETELFIYLFIYLFISLINYLV